MGQEEKMNTIPIGSAKPTARLPESVENVEALDQQVNLLYGMFMHNPSHPRRLVAPGSPRSLKRF